MTKRKWIFCGIMELIFIAMAIIGKFNNFQYSNFLYWLGIFCAVLLPLLFIKLLIEFGIDKFSNWLNKK